MHFREIIGAIVENLVAAIALDNDMSVLTVNHVCLVLS